MKIITENIIEVKNLKKNFDEKTVVDNISFSVKKHSFFAFLGQNGAGKTTTINMIIGLSQPDGGGIFYNENSDFKAFKNRIGVVFQNNISDELLTVEENLLTYGMLYMNSQKQVKKRLGEVAKLLSLGGLLKQRFKTLSGGEKRKTEIARALFMSPEILFLDEPTTGLDPKTRAEVWSIINKLKNDSGMTIFLTTHYVEETASADYVAIIDSGKIAASGSPSELKSKYTFDRLLITPKDASAFERTLDKLKIERQKISDTYTIKINDTVESIDFLWKSKESIRYYEVIKGSMDDVFLNVVGESGVSQ